MCKVIYKIIKASTKLQDFIKDYLLLHFIFDQKSIIPIKPFPANTDHCLVFYLRGSVTAFESKSGISKIFPKISVNASQISRFDFHLSHSYLMLSVNFKPQGLSKFLRLPLTEFIDERIDAETILNPEIHQVHERMANTNCYEGILQIVEDYLWKRIQCLKTESSALDDVIHLISENPYAQSVEKMASYACLSISQFERRFMQQIGITPKLFARINRFYQAYQLKDRYQNVDWLSIALQTGYHDYQHLVKDFKQFSNTTPHTLLMAQSQAPERILGLG